VAFLVVGVAGFAANPRMVELTDRALTEARGLSDESQVLSPSLACAYSTIVEGEVTSDGCTGEPNGTVCVWCLNSSGMGKKPGTTGGPGIEPKGSRFACQNRYRYESQCINGSCDTGKAVQVGKCSGEPEVYISQD
jgi:hypothetical protein